MWWVGEQRAYFKNVSCRKSTSALRAHGVRVGSWTSAGWTGLSSEASERGQALTSDRSDRARICWQRHQEGGAFDGWVFFRGESLSQLAGREEKDNKDATIPAARRGARRHTV